MMPDAPSAGMKFRAVLVDSDSTRERPVVIYSNSFEETKRWANEVLKLSTDEKAAVNVFQSIEQHIAIIRKPKPEAPKE